MVHFILGRGGTGKTSYLYEKIMDKIDSCKKIYLVVPEQVSFTREKKIIELIKEKYPYYKVEVISFSWIANNIFKEYGGICRNFAKDGTKNIVMYQTLIEVKEYLKRYRGMEQDLKFIEKIINFINKLKTVDIYPEDLQYFQKNIVVGDLKNKLEDICVIYDTYNRSLGEEYLDPSDFIKQATDILEKEKFFDETIIMFDEFDNFSVSQMLMIEKIISQGKEVYFSLRNDKNHIQQDDLFYYNNKTYNDIKRIARDQNIQIYEEILLKNRRQKSNGLSIIEREYENDDTEIYYGVIDDIKIINCNNLYDEVDYIAKEILNNIKNHGYRYKDICIITRNTEMYKERISYIFSKYDIPYFIDVKEGIENSVIVKFIIYILKIYESNYDSLYIINLLKLYTSFFKKEDIGELENYIYIWNIKGKLWSEEFVFNPMGFQKEIKSSDIIKLELFNNIRKYIVEKIDRMKEFISEGLKDGHMGESIYKCLIEFGMDRYIEERAEEANLKEDFILVEYYVKLWDIGIEIIEIIEKSNLDKNFKIKDFIKIFKLIVTSYDFGKIPQMEDSIIIYDATRSIYEDIKISFLVGMNKEYFPKEIETDGIFSGEEQEILEDIGLSGMETSKFLKSREDMYLYKSICSASKRIYFSYNRNINLKSVEKSNIIEKIYNQFDYIKEVVEEDENRINYCYTEESLFYQLSKNIRKKDEEISSIIDVGINYKDYKKRIEKLLDIVQRNSYEKNDKNLSINIYEKNMVISSSKIETFYTCPYKFFCRYGLNIRELKKAELNNLEIGNFIHHIIYKIVSNKRYIFVKLTIIKLKKEISNCLKKYIEEDMGGYRGKTERFFYWYNKIGKKILDIVIYIQQEMIQSKFVPKYFEAKVGFQGDILPLEISTRNGNKGFIEGYIDRIDILSIYQENYVRIIDYKTGIKILDLKDIYYGIDMQMFIYLSAICKNGIGDYKNIMPSGVLYMPFGDKKLELSRGDSKDRVELDREKRYIMNGIVLADEEIIDCMDNGIKNKYLEVKKNSKDLLDKKGVYTLEEFSIIDNYVSHKIEEMIDMLDQGYIEKKILSKGIRENSCIYCEYNTICTEDINKLIIDKTSKNINDLVVKKGDNE